MKIMGTGITGNVPVRVPFLLKKVKKSGIYFIVAE
jgi:hypothetical protein